MVQHPYVEEIGGQPPTAAPLPWFRRPRWPWLALGVGLVGAVLLILAYVPYSQSTSFQLDYCGGVGASIDVPLGTSLSIRWSAGTGVPVGLGVYQNGGQLYLSNAASGAASVSVSGYGAVMFEPADTGEPCTVGTAYVHVSWQAALLWPLVRPD